MNYSVHAVMYSYYFLQQVKKPFLRQILKTTAPYITTVQIVQMVVGMSVISFSAYAHLTQTYSQEGATNTGEGCAVDPANYKLGLAMYASYFVLFALLFYQNYVIGKGKKSGSRGHDLTQCPPMKNVGDSAGFFHGDDLRPLSPDPNGPGASSIAKSSALPSSSGSARNSQQPKSAARAPTPKRTPKSAKKKQN